jgi:hypothetical protein
MPFSITAPANFGNYDFMGFGLGFSGVAPPSTKPRPEIDVAFDRQPPSLIFEVRRGG